MSRFTVRVDLWCTALQLLSTIAQWLLLSPSVIMMQLVHSMVTLRHTGTCTFNNVHHHAMFLRAHCCFATPSASAADTRLLAVVAWLAVNVLFCFAILGPDVGPEYLRVRTLPRLPSCLTLAHDAALCACRRGSSSLWLSPSS